MLLPLQGALLTAIIPRAMPWARSFWAFSPYLNHMRKFCYRKSSAKKMQTSAMKAGFQIAECSFSSAKIAKKTN